VRVTCIRPAASWSVAAGPAAGVTVYGCARDEAALFHELGPRLGVLATVTETPVCEANVELALGDRCISVDHKTPVTNPTLRALSRAGVRYLSTRSIGTNHVDVRYAESLGISVEGVTYSPDSVADYTVMLMLMALRHAKSVICRADTHDYRLNDVRGRELRDLTVGVVGTGRIGAAVVDRLCGFGCRVLTHDNRPSPTGHVPLLELLRQSDIVTLHTPLTADTRHLLDRRRIEQLKPGAVVVNTGRGALVDTEALVSALEDRSLGGAALDVVEGEEGVFYADRRDEPVASELLLKLQAMPNVLISPHTAYYTDHALSDMVENTLVNCLSFEKRSRGA
jgi:D-specific alpha-keto acid dehydrogenase